MTTYSAREIIRNEYGDSKNFMTPTVMKAGKIDPTLAYELSRGEGFDHETIFGVSIVEVIGTNPLETRRNSELSEMFHARRKAEHYIQYLKDTAPVMHREPLP